MTPALPLILSLLLVLLLCPNPAFSGKHGGYQALPGLIDLRTTFSDGSHTIEETVQLARSRGFRVVFFNDHDRIALRYGLPPFRNIFRYKKEFPSIMTHTPERYLREIQRVAAEYPDMILVPGCITSPFYYWSGSWLKGDLTVHQYDRRILILAFENPEDYARLPNVGNRRTFRYTRQLAPAAALFVVPMALGLLLILRWRGFFRMSGCAILALSCLALVDADPFRSSPYSPYDGEQGIAPFQEVIDFVHERGGLAFWNYPEQRSGVRKHGPIFVNTPPYPDVLYQAAGYTGFAAIYGDNITATDPGKEWDRVLNEFCRGERRKPVWGISTADFHEDGRLGLKLGAFPTTFLVKRFTKEAVLEAIRKGRMYSSRGDGATWPMLDDFSVAGSRGGRAVMGETLTTDQPPLIRFSVSLRGGESGPVKILLIRGGVLLGAFEGKTPFEVEVVDQDLPSGQMTYYRLMDSRKHLTSNPIFVQYR